MKILITGVTGFKNRGVEALVLPTIRELQSLFPAAGITITSWTPEYDKGRLADFQNVDVVLDPYLHCGSWGGESALTANQARIRKLKRKIGIVAQQERQKPTAELLPYPVPDLVLVSGGDLISSDYGTNSLKHFLDPVHWAKAHGIPSALIGQSIGRFRNEDDIKLWKQAAAAASLITVREPLTRNYLVNELGDAAEQIVQAADTAFLLAPDPSMDASFSSAKKTLTVGLSISNVISKLRGQDQSKHIDTWIDVIRHMLDQWNAEVVLVPHVQETYTDDRLTGTLIWRRLGFDPRVSLLAADLTAAEFKAALKNCDLVVAERMHAAIGALSSGVCTVPIGYSIKARGIITQMFDGTHINPDSMVMDLEDFLKDGQAISFLNEVWDHRTETASVIRSRLPEIKALALRNFELIKNLIRV